ncbi:hypothetical protein BVC80_9049g12 [Macleaya cordata]|uniref:Uncharacterized protein n=1 Tax=Macleaya cordata TaxID=56857 RepID=A0A200R2D4_MACCD|nr:hypothetical protein BVC80_9049g12 [Macleaya cordata]
MGERSEEPERDELAESVNDFFTTVSTMIKCEFQEEFANSAADFLHRIGRIARVGQSGLVPSFYNEPNPDLVTEVRQAGKLGQPVPHFQSTIMEKSISFTQPMDEQGDQGTSISGEDSWLHEALEDEKALGDHKIDSLKPSQTSNEVVLNSSSGEDLLVPNSLSLLKRYSSDDEDECHDISLQEDIVRTPEVGWDCTSIFDTDKVFHSREELTSWCKAVGRTAGVVVGIRKSDRGKVGRGARISYWCSDICLALLTSTLSNQIAEQERRSA